MTRAYNSLHKCIPTSACNPQTTRVHARRRASSIVLASRTIKLQPSLKVAATPNSTPTLSSDECLPVGRSTFDGK